MKIFKISKRLGFDKKKCDQCGGLFGLTRRHVGANQFCKEECLTAHRAGVPACDPQQAVDAVAAD